MALSMILLGVFKVVELNLALFIFLLLFILAYQLSQGSIAWLYVAEVTVDQASGLVTSGQFINLLWLSLTMEYMIDGSLQAQGTFWLFGLFSTFGTVFVAIFVRESRGLSDKDLKQLYVKKGVKPSTE